MPRSPRGLASARTVSRLTTIEANVKDQYLISIRLIERLHRRFLDVIKAELDRLGIEDINNVQTLILFNINEEQLTVGELTVRGYYLGSNVSYNVKKLVENDYLIQERSSHDRRMTGSAVPEGSRPDRRISDLYQRNSEELAGKYVAEEQLAQTNQALMSLSATGAARSATGRLRCGSRRGIVRAARGRRTEHRDLTAGQLRRLLQPVELLLQRFHALLQLAHLVIEPGGLAHRRGRPDCGSALAGPGALLFAGIGGRNMVAARWNSAMFWRAMSSNWVSGKKRPKVCSCSRASGPDCAQNSPCSARDSAAGTTAGCRRRSRSAGAGS